MYTYISVKSATWGCCPSVHGHDALKSLNIEYACVRTYLYISMCTFVCTYAFVSVCKHVYVFVMHIYSICT